jgi:hypothetical protein
MEVNLHQKILDKQRLKSFRKEFLLKIQPPAKPLYKSIQESFSKKEEEA